VKAITIQQPWAHLIVHGYFDPQTGDVRRKDVENRCWPCSHRGPLAIHAGKGLDYLHAAEGYGLNVADMRFGAIVGIVEMYDCLPLAQCHDSQWAEGPWCHLYRKPRPVGPVPCKGMLGLWAVPADVLAAIQGRATAMRTEDMGVQGFLSIKGE
jgi:hypothetical protein